MLHRVDTPLPISTSNRYVSITNDHTDNWSGYAPNLQGASHKVNETYGYFTVSLLKTYGPDTATWIGVGGLNTDETKIVQAGVDVSMFDAWYEYYPNAPKYIYGVDPGDTMYVDVWYDQGTNEWDTFFMDDTLGTYSSASAFFNADQTSADYINEVQYASPYNVPSINTITFSSSYWVDNNGARQALNSNEAATLDKVYLDQSRSSGRLCPSGLFSAGDGFTISNC
ncbi:MAG: G1 family glutamic endopeptidase [Ktedonobacterales bacterium]